MIFMLRSIQFNRESTYSRFLQGVDALDFDGAWAFGVDRYDDDNNGQDDDPTTTTTTNTTTT